MARLEVGRRRRARGDDIRKSGVKGTEPGAVFRVVSGRVKLGESGVADEWNFGSFHGV
jgi:hypothetical protein